MPDQPTITGADSSITVSFTSYSNLGSMMKMDDEFSSSVLSVNVLGVEKVMIFNTVLYSSVNDNGFAFQFGNTIPLSKPIEFELYHKPMADFSARKCVYWDFVKSSWSSDGCYPISDEVIINIT